MKKMLILGIALTLLAGCGHKEKEETSQKMEEETLLFKPYERPVIFETAPVSASLSINVAMGNKARTMTYQQDSPLTLPDGTVVKQGDLKPTWQYIQKELGFSIADVTDPSAKAGNMISNEYNSGFTNATIYGGNSVASKLMNYGAQGSFVNLKKYLKYMPNLTEYLDNNPNIAKAITAYDGGIYHLPYVAEINNYARIFNGRADWVTSLLDSTAALIPETHTLNVAYNGYWNRYASNIIDLQNQAARRGILDQITALNTLKNYIKETYPELAKPSDLYLGKTARYDIDELVALWRVIELSPNTLSKVTTGEVVAGANMVPYFARKANYRDEVFRLLTFFEGQRVHASDSATSGILYADNDNQIVYSYASESFLRKVEYLKQWYSEGLLYERFADTSNKDFRTGLIFSDSKEGQKEFGFMTMDWIASTMSGNDKITGFLPPVTTIPEAGITQFIHYMENTRSIKPDGWSISAAASEADRNAALILFDYIFSQEGQTIQNYSIPDAWVEDERFIGPDGTEYPKFNQWIIEAAGELKSGDVAGFLRDFMGSLIPIGYQKERGVELQFTNSNGLEAWNLYTKENVLTMTYDSTEVFLRLMPPIISLTEEDLNSFKGTNISGARTQVIFDYITGSDNSISSYKDLRKMFEDYGIEKYEAIHQNAYVRMMEDK